MRRITLSFLLFIMVFQVPAQAGEGLFSPDYAVTQFAGQIGVLSVGAGKRFEDSRWEMELLLGHVPASMVGKDVTALALKSRYRMTSLTVDTTSVTAYAGFGLHYYLGEAYKVDGPYDPGYYPYSSWHLMPHLGIRMAEVGREGEGPALYIEAGMLDEYLINYANNTDYHQPSDVISIAVGIVFPID